MKTTENENENPKIEGKIYKIVCNKTGKCYVGSTRLKYLCDRLAKHTYNYRKFKDGSSKKTLTSFKVLENDDYDIHLLENVPFNAVEELYQREKYHIINTPNCVNKTIPTRTLKEYRQDNLEKIKEKHNNPVKCNCGLFVNYCNMARHKKSTLHSRQIELGEKNKE